MTAEGDRELMVRVRGGEMAAFEALYARYSRPLLYFFHRLCWDRTFAEDLMQETFFRLWKGRGRYRPTGKFTTYLFQIAKNHWLNEREKRSRRIAPISLDASRTEESNGLKETVPDAGRGPADRALDHELGEKIAAATGALSEKLRLVFVLGQIDGMRYADIAEILGIPVGTVKSRMSNAEKALRGRLAAYVD